MARDIQESFASQRLALTQQLTQQQSDLVAKVLKFCETLRNDDSTEVFVIEGGPGTGKSLIMNHIFADIQSRARNKQKNDPLYGTYNNFLVNHAEMIKLYKELSESDPWTRKKDYLRPTTFINAVDREHKKADIVLIDEAHLLFTRPNRYNKFYQTNQLQEIIKRARRVILVFDPRQVLKFRSYWTPSRLKELLGNVKHHIYHLTEQFRMNAPPSVTQWIEQFCHHRNLTAIPKTPYLRIFDDAQKMYVKIRTMNRKYGLSRMLSTYDYFYRLDGHKYYIHEGKFRLPWDISCPMARLPWAERPNTIEEVGSVYTIQGFDLNYAGVIIGPSVELNCRYSTSPSLDVVPGFYEDYAAFYGTEDVDDPWNDRARIMMNALYVLLTRPRKGLFIYAHDERLRHELLRLWHQANG